MNRSFKIALVSLFVVPALTLSLLLYFADDINTTPQKRKAKQVPEKHVEDMETKFEVMWKSLPAPSEADDMGNLNIPVDYKGRIKPHIIKSESKVRYLIGNLEKNPIYPKIIKSFYFYRNVPGQWDKKKAIGLVNARMKTMQAGESKLWFQLAGVDAYARRYTRDVPNPGPSYANIFKYAKKLSELDLELFYRLIKEMIYQPSIFRRVREPREPRYLKQIIIELLPTYLAIEKLSDKEPTLPVIIPVMMRPFLVKFDKRKGKSFNEIYRSMLISQPIEILEKRLPQAIDHPEFAAQPDNIKRRLYAHMALRYCIDEYARDKQLMWLKKSVKVGGRCSRLLFFYFSYITHQYSKDRKQKKLEREFAYLKNTGLVHSGKKKPEFTREMAEYIEKNYVAGDRQKYVKLDNKLRVKYPNMYGPIQYLELVHLRSSKKARKDLIVNYHKACNKVYKKVLKDFSRPFDALEIFKFLNRVRQEKQAYKYLDDMISHINDPSEMRLRLAYIVAKKYAKNDRAKALSVINRVDLAKYDISSGGKLAFRVKMLSNYKARLEKQNKQHIKK
jgi:hypothetical protein